MYRIQLTSGISWDAPVLAEHPVRPGIHIEYVERMAQQLLNDARRTARGVGPTNYRVIDAFGRCVRSSATAKTRRAFVRRAGRTYWPRGGGAPASG